MSVTAPRLAFVSTAHIHARPFLEWTRDAKDRRLVHAVWDDQPERGRRHAQLAKARFEPDLDTLLSDAAVDGFVICAENTRHLALLREVLATGKPVLCEKPLATTVADAREIVALLQSNAARLCCGYFLPFTSDLRAAAAMLARGEFGHVTQIRIRNSHGGAYARLFDSPDLRWFTEPALAGGGAFMDVGSHAVHLARTLFGPVTDVWAEIGNHSGIYPTCDDFGIAHLRFASGALGTLEASWTETGGENALEIVGAEKSLWKAGKAYVTGFHGRGEPQPLVPAEERPAQIDRLVAMIRGELTDAERKSDFAACVDAVAIMEACYASAKSGRWTKVGLL